MIAVTILIEKTHKCLMCMTFFNRNIEIAQTYAIYINRSPSAFDCVMKLWVGIIYFVKENK